MATSVKSQSDSRGPVPARRSEEESTCLDAAAATHPAATSVLLVEDDETIAAGLCFFLEEAGYLVEWSQVGSGVISKVIAEPPNLLILDVQLGDANGREIYRSLRNAGVVIPVVLVSGSEIITARELDDAAAFLAKPFAIAELLRTASVLLAAV